MTITSTQDGTTLTLAVDGRIDTNTSPDLQNAILKAFQGAKKVILDFAKVAYISSAGLRVLLATAKQLKPKGGLSVFANLQGNVREVFEMTGFCTILGLYDSVDAALAALGDGA